MAWTISTALETATWAAAERILPRRALAGNVLSQAIVARSRRYTSDRSALHEPLPKTLIAADLAARTLFFGLADAAKVQIPVAELASRELLPASGTLEIIDVGAGTGAMSLGAVDRLHREGFFDAGGAVVIRAFDRDSRALAMFAAVVSEVRQRWGIDVRLENECLDVVGGEFSRHFSARSDTRPGADLVVLGSVLNELEVGERRDLVRAAVAQSGERGSVIIIEPALRATARALHELRDWVLAERVAHVFAPCTRREVTCPALALDTDWCHEDRPTSLPPRLAKLARQTGLRSHGLKFAYLVLRDRYTPILPVEAGQCALRVVSRPFKSKGKRECHVCGDAGRHMLRLLRRNRGGNNRQFEKARRGDLLRAPGRLADGGDIAEDDVITVTSMCP